MKRFRLSLLLTALMSMVGVRAMAYDAEGNLWLTNTGDLATNIHVLDPNHRWHSFNLYQGGQRIVLNTVSKFLVDNRNPNYKWIASARKGKSS